MRRMLKKILPRPVLHGIRQVKAFLVVLVRNWERFKKENPEAYAREQAERANYE